MDREIPFNERRRRLTRKLTAYVCAATAAATAGYGLYEWSLSSVRMSDLSLTKVSRGDIETTISATARVVPAFEEIITSPLPARVLEVYHRIGDRVEAGTALLRLDITEAQTDYDKRLDALTKSRLGLEQLRGNIHTRLSDLAMRIKVAEMKVKRLEAQHAGERYLDSIGSGTTDRVREAEFALCSEQLSLEQLRQQYDNEKHASQTDLRMTELDIEICEKELAVMRRNLADAEIRVRRRSTVTEISDQIGSQVAEGMQVARIADLSHYKLAAEAPDGYAGQIAIGCRTHMKIKGRTVDGRVVNIAPTSSNGMISFTVVPDCDSLEVLRPGLKGDIHVSSGLCSNALRIDNAPFYNQPGMYSLYVIDGDRLVRRNVQLGRASYDHIEVIAGLAEGETIVTNDLSRYKSSPTIKIKH